ncbi:hypothetical protein SPRG_01060 [Saprolegnia parasitica CBS 223.65]|uniref:DnaJ homologue subfamily C GRV2/DNAJC13 N-terminal domain-containing protein n=1 Tax=Saprolegnia parasitica (strain CBS 223.65) TaxID=695850 RepID=A0A067D7K9_SAPPC|nr:hypothetical protein SPRG_01060 [Saprolegnia parasitica CBS 223.65]KDO34997.1 hypothetical protein SPRG_01060 [Saprolegnia parasitica CBS 223.65]|eukprot:XP_012194650.1 hypothetical protein SPRG_01060 [Saprolegnia parasitica CBS 223.65]
MQVFRSFLGAAGSADQRNAIKDVIAMGDAGKKRSKDDVLHVLHAFCDVFPLEADRKSMDMEDDYDVKDRKLYDAVYRLLKVHVDTSASGGDESDVVLVLLDTLKRILKWRDLHKLVPKYSTKPLLTCMMWTPVLALSVLQVVTIMMLRPTGLKSAEIGDKMEMMNKRTFADDRGYPVLCSLVAQHSVASDDASHNACSSSILQQALQLFHMTLISNKQTTDPVTLERAAESLLQARETLLRLSHHEDPMIRHVSVDLLFELFLLAGLDQVTLIQDSARESGALLYMLAAALDDVPSADELQVAIRDKSIALVEMFCAGNARSKAAMYRILPVELFVPIEDRPDLVSKYSIATLKKATKVTQRKSIPVDFAYMGFPFRPEFSASGSIGPRPPLEFQRWLQDARAQGEKWTEVLLATRQAHERPTLVWRAPMLRELQSALRNEIASFEAKVAATPTVRTSSGPHMVLWDYDQFQITYASFASELIVHGYFIEHLIPKLANLADPFEVDDLMVLAWHLSDRLSVEENAHWRHCCVKCLRLMMRRYAMTFNGQLPVAGLLRQLAVDDVDPSFACEAFLLFHVAISTSRTRPTESLSPFYASILSVVLSVLQQAPTRIAGRPSRLSMASTLSEGGDDESFHLRLTFDVEYTQEESSAKDDDAAADVDAMVRAGVNIILVILQRAKAFVPQVLNARMSLGRLLTSGYLSHKTLHTLISLLSHICSHLQTDDSLIYTRSLLPLVFFASANVHNKGMCIAAASFLAAHYSPSDVQSLLETSVGFRGCGMHLLLPTPMVLAAVFNHDTIQSADVIWSAALRLKLLKSLATTLHVALPLTDDDVDEDKQTVLPDFDVPVGHLFLRSFVECHGSFRAEWSREMYEETLMALTRHVVLSRTRSLYGINLASDDSPDPMALQVLALKALALFLPASPHDIALDDALFDALLQPLRRTLLGEVDQERTAEGLRICRLLIAPELGNVNARACLTTLCSPQTMQLLRDALEKTLHPRFLQFLKEQPCDEGSAMALLTALLDTLAAMAQSLDGVAALQNHPRWITSVIAHASTSHIQGLNSDKVATVCLRFLQKLCVLPALQQVFIDAGGLISISDVCIAVDQADPRTHDTVELAASVLQACLPEPGHAMTPAFAALTQLYTPGLVQLLSKSTLDFLCSLQSPEPIYQPTLVWTLSMQDQLRDALRSEQAKMALNAKSATTWPVWDPDNFVAADSFRYLYPEVANEVLVAHVYLRAFVQSDSDQLPDMIDLPQFTKALLYAMESSEAALLSIKARGGNPQKQQALLELFRGALRKIAVDHRTLLDVRLPPFIEVDGFSDTESVGDTIQNLQESPTNHSHSITSDDEKPFTLDHQDSVPIDEGVV